MGVIGRLGTGWIELSLKVKKGFEIRRFEELEAQFEEKYRNLSKFPDKELTTPLWDEFNQEIEKVFLPSPPLNFLRNETIRRTMFVDRRGGLLLKEWAFIQDQLSAASLSAAEEDPVGYPNLLRLGGLPTSHNSVHHLYHLSRYFAFSGQTAADFETVVEWGGGYGNLAKIYRRLTDGRGTYVIIDTPIFSSLQWLYLSSVLGISEVNLLQSSSDPIVEGKVNLVSLGLLQDDIKGDLFISTWALSESSVKAQDSVVKDRDWFSCSSLLIGYQDSSDDLPDAGRMGELALAAGAKNEDIPELPGNHYAFR